MTRLSTGYTFLNIQEHSKYIVKNIDNIEKIRTPYEGTYNKKINKRFLDVYNKNQKASIITENSTWLQKYYNNNSNINLISDSIKMLKNLREIKYQYLKSL